MTQLLNHPDQIKFEYLKGGIEAKGHAPIYKMHKYFARRPHNVFRHLIEFYSKPGNIVLDCFCGGGVSLIEGLATHRKVVASDVNPLATFVTDCQTTVLNLEEYRKAVSKIRQNLSEFTDKWFKTICRQCEGTADIRWIELAYVVKCVHCNADTSLANSNKTVADGQPKNGFYDCQKCKRSFASASVVRNGEELVAVRIKCGNCGTQKSVKPVDSEKRSYLSSIKQFDDMVKRYKVWFPKDKIPAYWDRQREDCLHRKGFFRFSDLFTKRNLFFTAYFLRLVQMEKGKVTDDVYKILLFTFSATLRYTNNLNFSTDSWMGGRPIAWAKHAFWTPNQFVEVNPIEYFDKRVRAIEMGTKNQLTHLGPRIMKGETFKDLQSGKSTHVVWNTSSDHLALPNESIDLVLTDPPYGSNVQYGELCNFWLVWLRKDLGLAHETLDIPQEIVVHRKQSSNKDYHKGYTQYYLGMLSVFAECFRVLKPGAALVFTFNNRDIRAWFSVVSAAINAGFHLDPKGVVYQDAIGIYRDTSHARFSGALQGDFIYTFRKLSQKMKRKPGSPTRLILRDIVDSCIAELIDEKNDFQASELHTAVMWKVIPILADLASKKPNIEEIEELFSLDRIIDAVVQTGNFVESNGTWKRKSR